MLKIDELWNSKNRSDWTNSLSRYWNFVKNENVKIEERMEGLKPNNLRQLGPLEWYEFLRDDYFRWKYTANNRYATTTKALKRYIDEDRLEVLHDIKLKILNLRLGDIAAGLKVASDIHGLGIPGASGLLSLLYPDNFGTVDQFVVKALRGISGLPEEKYLANINENQISAEEGAVLIRIMSKKSRELNLQFNESFWTPRRVDMVLWTYGRKTDESVAKETAKTPDRAPRHSNLNTNPSQVTLGKAVTNHDMILSSIQRYRGLTLTTSDIKRSVLGAFPKFSPGSLLPNDHAQGNKSACACAGTNSRIFDKVETGKYRVR